MERRFIVQLRGLFAPSSLFHWLVIDDVIDDHTGNGIAEGGCDMTERAVDLRLHRAPFMLYQTLVTRSIVDGSVCPALATQEFCLGT